MTSSKVLTKEQSSLAKRWEAPLMDDSASAHVRCEDVEISGRPELPTAAQIEQWQREGREEGRRLGLKEGREAGRAEMKVQANRFEQLVDSLAQPFKEFDEQAEQELVQLALAIAKQVIRREIRTAPGEIVGVLREALAILPSSSREIVIELHPEDATLVRKTLSTNDRERGWRIHEDPLVTRGGCRVRSELSRIDATLENRLAALSSAILGGTREGE